MSRGPQEGHPMAGKEIEDPRQSRPLFQPVPLTLALEVVELERLIDDAEKASPQLWAAIRKSISVAELACDSMQTQGECRWEII